MRFHLEQRAAEFAAEGMTPDAARAAAHRRFGNVASLQEQARDTFGWGPLERFAKDLVLAARRLVRAPGYTLIAIATLGLGIGGTTAMFSLVSEILLKPLPYPHLARLEQWHRATPRDANGAFPAADFIALRAARTDHGDLAGFVPAPASIAAPGEPPEVAAAARSSANFFSVLGVAPALGRDFAPDEETAGRDRVVILSQRLWRARFDGRADAIGRTLRIDGVPHLVIGVLPESFNDWRHLGWVDFFRPLVFEPAQAENHDTPLVEVIGRTAAGRGSAGGFAAAFGARVAAAFPAANAGVTWRTEPLQRTAGGSGGELVLPLLLGLSGAVLLIACSNLANLLLARTVVRAREFAVRGALGASRLQLLRPVLAESLLLSLAGGALAVAVTTGFAQWVALRSTADNGEQVRLAIDWTVMTWAGGAALATALAFGTAPALYAWRLDLVGTLKSGGRGNAGTPAHQRFRRVLVVAQFALAMTLLAGAGLFLRGLDDLQNRRSGWDSAAVATGSLLVPSSVAGDAGKLAAFHERTLVQLAALPGAESASLAAFTPFWNWPDVRPLVLAGREPPPAGREPAAMFNAVSPRFFATFGIPLVAGRGFDATDRGGTTAVAMIDQTTARALFGERSPLGQRLAVASDAAPAWCEIVGVVGDLQSADPTPPRAVFRVYRPLAQDPRVQVELAVRSRGAAPAALVPDIRAAIAALDAELPVRRLSSADAVIVRALYQLRVLRDLLGAFAVLGLGLATLGVYGVVARTVAQRSGEFAVRLALGARAADLRRLVLAFGVRQVLLGGAIGLAGAIGVSAAIRASYPGIRANETAAYGAALALLVATALFACWWPARRAAGVDAAHALRAE